MISFLLSLLSHGNENALAIIAVLCIIGFVAVGQLLLKEKDKEIELEKEMVEKVTVGLKYVNDTQDAILIYLKRDEKK
jgi:hypothetical protein